jgi:hypothetical protein
VKKRRGGIQGQCDQSMSHEPSTAHGAGAIAHVVISRCRAFDPECLVQQDLRAHEVDSLGAAARIQQYLSNISACT